MAYFVVYFWLNIMGKTDCYTGTTFPVKLKPVKTNLLPANSHIRFLVDWIIISQVLAITIDLTNPD